MSDYIECPHCGATTFTSLEKLYGRGDMRSWHHCNGSVSASALRRIVAEELRKALKELAPPSASQPAPSVETGIPQLQQVDPTQLPQTSPPTVLADNLAGVQRGSV